ncbi:jg9782 [Pararge aegeria aegeria]|uniref:Jg9782 protein n=1 Tax=Pararge aegeria aegeria TaxID=348720 RepID=A0A8S4RLI1_9NEOP|nr:jg9782 [Pararge aegeria aegeria]
MISGTTGTGFITVSTFVKAYQFNPHDGLAIGSQITFKDYIRKFKTSEVWSEIEYHNKQKGLNKSLKDEFEELLNITVKNGDPKMVLNKDGRRLKPPGDIKWGYNPFSVRRRLLELMKQAIYQKGFGCEDVWPPTRPHTQSRKLNYLRPQVMSPDKAEFNDITRILKNGTEYQDARRTRMGWNDPQDRLQWNFDQIKNTLEPEKRKKLWALNMQWCLDLNDTLCVRDPIPSARHQTAQKENLQILRIRCCSELRLAAATEDQNVKSFH